MSTSELRIEKRRQLATVGLLGERRLAGRFFLGGAARTRNGDETLYDLLNDDSVHFVPFLEAESDRVQLLSAGHIAWVGLVEPQLEARFDQCRPGTLWKARVELVGESLEGTVFSGDLHPDRRRVVDLLNHPSRFLMLRRDDQLMLVNKSLIQVVVPA